MTDDLQPHEQYVIDVLQPLQRGTLLTIMADKLQEAIERVESLQKRGKLTLSIDIVPETNGQFGLAGQVTSKLPVPTATSTAFFLLPDGKISVDDPMQKSFDDVVKFTPPKRNVRNFDVETGEIDDD